jgi:pimeloyl-ACP methyl ester carboxylesterase
VHPYLVGHSEGAACSTSSARAASPTPPSRADSPVVIYGHSQGGHAALMAAEIAPTYAPELDVVGTIAAAPRASSRSSRTHVGGGGGAGGFGLMMTRRFLDAYPHLSSMPS